MKRLATIVLAFSAATATLGVGASAAGAAPITTAASKNITCVNMRVLGFAICIPALYG